MEVGVLGTAVTQVQDQLENSSKVSMRVLRTDPPPGKWEMEFVGKLLRSMHCENVDL